MSDGRSRERDLVLAPNEYAFISDMTKGNINVYVGPYKTSLANTDQPVYFDRETKRFIRCNLEESMQLFATAPEGWYLIMKNPPRDELQPGSGTVSNVTTLSVGHKVNIPGPRSFALWPGQMVSVVKGHHIRSNQYLLVRVYDEESARQNWSEAVIKPQAGVDEVSAPADAPDLTMGKILVIKGTEVSFYIPPTGVEVVRGDRGEFIREAVTLERLEYCILLDEGGNKRYIQGPAVVFPEPTEDFVERDGSRKFRAIELNELSGIYIKVIAPYEENGVAYTVGQELFITGKEQMIYFPRPEHAIIRYGAREIHYAVAIPAGEGRYCLDRQSGQVRLVRGPTMFLPDPRREVTVRRVLSPNQVAQWFPGNQEAAEYNKQLKELTTRTGEFVLEEDVRGKKGKGRRQRSREEYAGDEINRKSQFTPPRTITLDTKYDGAVSVGPWTGYAILVVSRTGERKVVVGPQTVLLEYDETLEIMSLSKGTPKSDKDKLKTAYLRVQHNKVSDIVSAETRDLVQVHVKLSYRVNFEGDPNQWFNVENYVKFLTDHMRSILRNRIKHLGVQEFYDDSIDIIRSTILGQAGEDGKRPGRAFDENGMRIYDVEVLDVKIGDAQIESMLTQAQHAVVSQTLELAAEERRLGFVERSETVKRQILDLQAETMRLELGLRAEEVSKQLEVRLAEIDARNAEGERTLDGKLTEQEALTTINDAELGRTRSTRELQLELSERQLQQRLSELQAQVQAVVSKAEAVSPDLIAALQAFGDKALVERVSESMAPLAILGGTSISDVVSNLLKGTALERVTLPPATDEE